MKKKFYYLFIGDWVGDISKAEIRFVVESETQWEEGAICRGRVVAKNEGVEYYDLGVDNLLFVNPFDSLKNHEHVPFIPIARDAIAPRFANRLPEID